jgi:hypothetical protein
VIRRHVSALLLAVLALGLVTIHPETAAATHGGPTFNIRTVPAIPQYPVTLDGKTRYTDRSGIARFHTSDRRSPTDRVTLHNRRMKVDGKDVRVSGARIFGQGDPRIALHMSWRVQFEFRDINGEPVDPQKIRSVLLKSSTGEVRRVSPTKAVWLQGSRIVPLAGGLENKKIFWTVQEVDYASANVVNASQQRFQPADTQKVALSLLFYRTRVEVHDAFFGFPVGHSVSLTYPDSSVEVFPLDDAGRVALPSLPRGTYGIVANGFGVKMSRPVAISRDQELRLQFYSWLDVALVLEFGLLFALGIPWLGRRRRLAHRQVDGEDRPAPQRRAAPIRGTSSHLSWRRRLRPEMAQPRRATATGDENPSGGMK